MRKNIIFALVAILTLTTVGCAKKNSTDKETTTETTTETTQNASNEILQNQLPKEGDEIVILTTSLGEIKLQLYPEEAPKAVENFESLVNSGYYDGITFHRVINNFMIQSGDPTGTGMGGESSFGKDFEDEISPNLHFYRGALAMANSGPNTNGSQFFIVQNKKPIEQALNSIIDAKNENKDLGITIGSEFYTLNQLYPENVLNYYKENGGSIELEPIFGNIYTVFGQVFEGLDVVDSIAEVEVSEDNNKPTSDIYIEKAEIVKYQP